MVEFVAAALIVSGFWMLLEIGRFVFRELSKDRSTVNVSAGPGREYVERYAEAFWRLAESYQEMPKKKEHFGDVEVEHIFAQAREEVCSCCERQENCWEDNFYETCRQVYGCLRRIEDGEETEAEEEAQFQSYCSLAEEFARRMRELFYRSGPI